MKTWMPFRHRSRMVCAASLISLGLRLVSGSSQKRYPLSRSEPVAINRAIIATLR